MTLSVGTDSYISIADADAYWANRNNGTWANAAQPQKEKALREATQFIDGAYEFIGQHPGPSSQLLAWPRNNAIVKSGNLKGVQFTGIPEPVKDATAELALEALDERLRPSQDRGGAVKREKVDVIEVEYMGFAPGDKTFSFVTMLLKPLLSGTPNTVNLVRT